MDILFIFGLILLNGVFAMSEIALVSSRQVRLEKEADAGSETARAALKLSREPTRFMSTIQVGITLIGILAGAMGEASIAERIEVHILEVDLLAPWAEPLSLTLMVIIITYFSLIFGELVPKRLAMHNPEAIAKVVAHPMNLLSKVARPLVVLLSISTEAILKLLGTKKAEEMDIIEEEIHSLMKQGTEAGVLEESEHTMVRNVLRLDDQRVSNIMTLRKEVYYIDLEDGGDDNLQKVKDSTHSRIPVCKGGIDNVIGFLHSKDVMNQVLGGKALDISDMIKRPLFVPSSATALQLLEQFKKSRVHLAIVVDEHGQTSGLVSVNDVLEAIVGDMPADDQEYEPDFIEREDGSWLVNALVDISEFKEKFGIRSLPEEEQGNYSTLGGLIMTVLGHIPKVTTVLTLANVQLEVLDMDGNRVDKVLVTRLLTPLADNDNPPEVQSGYRD
ncbi:MAG: HlyC/CorC family transporter [Gammaproteobacteria bacterium]|nr:HlyC/CorC family transporter [Gammaproteobacteria bacterium]